MGNDKNEYPDPDLKKTIMNVTNELSDSHKQYHSKSQSWTRSQRNAWTSYKKQLTRKNRMCLRTIQTPKIKKKKTWEDTETIKWTQDFNKHQSETNDGIKN
jgi:hypothetical protein